VAVIWTGTAASSVWPTGEVAATLRCNSATASASASVSMATLARMAEKPACPGVRPRKLHRSMSPSTAIVSSRMVMPGGRGVGGVANGEAVA
jgi:hypothetical protein